MGKKKVTAKPKKSNKRRSKKKPNFFSICLKVIIFIFNSFFKYIIKPFYYLISFLFKKMSEPISIKIKKRVGQRIKKKKEEIQQKQEQEEKKVKVLNSKKRKSIVKFQNFKEVKNIQGNLEDFNKFLFTNQSTIGLILGARGTGKSAIGMSLLENFASKTNKTIYAMGFKQHSVPDWIKVVDSIGEINIGSVLLVDEGGIQFSSRNTMSSSNKLLSEILLIARHKDLSVIFITQNSSNLEVNIIRQADYLLLKPSSLLQKDFERKKIKDIYNSVDDQFNALRDNKGLTYLYSNHYSGFLTNKLPSFWSDKVSKGYSDK